MTIDIRLRQEVSEVLLSSGISKERCEQVLRKMFKGLEGEEMGWEVFRLWLKRDGFADRTLCWQEQVFYTFDEPGSSKVAMIWVSF